MHFPGAGHLTYLLEPSDKPSPGASFDGSVIRIGAPLPAVRNWAASESIGLYFDLPAEGAALKVAIEKDLECIDGPEEERDPEAFERIPAKRC